MTILTNSLVRWITSVVRDAPNNIRLVYLEWNNAPGQRSRDVLSFYAFGYTLTGFDPEDPASLDQLPDWQWESPTGASMACTSKRDDSAVRDALLTLFNNDKSITSPLLTRGGQIAFGRHESSVYVFPESTAAASSDAYYELHVADDGNHVEVQDDVLDNDPDLLDRVESYQPIDYPLSENATFHLQSRGKELDLLWDVCWFICSARMRDLIQQETSHCQIFPIRLYRSKKVNPEQAIPDYYVVHLHEQLRCLEPKDVLPPPYKGALPTFDPEKGYRIVRSKVKHRNIFRIAYEHQRLLVSQSFRDKCEELGITGIEWLRRESVP